MNDVKDLGPLESSVLYPKKSEIRIREMYKAKYRISLLSANGYNQLDKFGFLHKVVNKMVLRLSCLFLWHYNFSCTIDTRMTFELSDLSLEFEKQHRLDVNCYIPGSIQLF